MSIKTFFFILLFSPFLMLAQTTIGLAAYYAFDGDAIDGTGSTSNTGQLVGTPTYVCGVQGQAVLLDGANDQIRILNSANVSGEFDTEDFTVSFYFKPVGFNGTQYLFSKRDTACSNPRQFSITYFPGAKLIKTLLAQDDEKDVELNNIVANLACWQHLAVVRKDNRVKIYLNGVYQNERGTASRVNLNTAGPIYIGGGDCLGGIETPFSGIIDELRVYDRSLSDDEVSELYFRPDEILTSDTIVFLNTNFDVTLGNSCGTLFEWTPADNVVSPGDPEPTIFADEPGDITYQVQIRDQVSTCVAIDSFRVTVVDPNTLPCAVAMPNAFTPNRDNLNDTYGLSNPFAITDMVSFEIFDRWGARVFMADSAFDRWDASFQDEQVNPGVFLWKVVYRCSGVENSETGTVTVLR